MSLRSGSMLQVGDDTKIDEVHENYRRAIEDLRQINDDLFYDDLKTKLRDHLDRLELSYETSTKGIEAMKGTIKRVPLDIDHKMEELNKAFTQHSFQILDEMKKVLRDSYLKSEASLHKIIEAFVKLQNNFMTIQNNFSHLNQVQLKLLNEMDERIHERFGQLDQRISSQNDLVKEVTAGFSESAAAQLSTSNEQYAGLLAKQVEDKRRSATNHKIIIGLMIVLVATEAIRIIFRV
jgi:hypothetical protein